MRNSSATARRAAEIRGIATEVAARSGQAYIGQALGTADILACVYEIGLTRPGDRFVLSPGHYGLALYAANAHLYDRDELMTYGMDGSEFEQSPLEGLPGVEITGGSLGQGLSQAAGMAVGQRIKGIPGTIFCLLSDGEIQEGQVWEAMLTIGHHKLSNLCVIVDRNGIQVDGRTEDVIDLEPLADKFRAFGFHTTEVDGHDLGRLEAAIGAALSGAAGRASAIICDTVIGKGVPAFEAHTYPHYISAEPAVWDEALRHLRAVAPEA
jgi:transketolase